MVSSGDGTMNPIVKIQMLTVCAMVKTGPYTYSVLELIFLNGRPM
jgi:hypothetical protein